MKRKSKVKAIPKSLKIAYSLFLLVLIPAYWTLHGPGNFLWISDLVLFVTYLAIMLESRLLVSMQAVGGIVLESFWIIDFVLILFAGIHLTGLTDYMFDENEHLLGRLLSLFHVALPPLLIWLVWRQGYDTRAWKYQSVLMILVIPLTFFLTDSADNINWVHGYQNIEPVLVNPALYLLVLTAVIVFMILLPTHLVLKRWKG